VRHEGDFAEARRALVRRQETPLHLLARASRRLDDAAARETQRKCSIREPP
jgi:hypothetical protein